MSRGTPLLEARGVTRRFGGGPGHAGTEFAAVENIDLEVRAGETLGIVGESGSGKTTLARLLLGLLEPSAGAVLFDGADLARLPRHELRLKRRELQIVFQDPATTLDPLRTVGEVLMEPFEAQGLGTVQTRRERVGELLSAVALDPGLARRPALSLSGGEQQRVVIARALALEPRLLIADEPVAALDPSIAAQILNLLAELRRSRRLTLVVISHSLSVVRHLASRVVVMRAGRIVEESDAGAFFAGPSHPYSHVLISSWAAARPRR